MLFCVHKETHSARQGVAECEGKREFMFINVNGGVEAISGLSGNSVIAGMGVVA